MGRYTHILLFFFSVSLSKQKTENKKCEGFHYNQTGPKKKGDRVCIQLFSIHPPTLPP
jgi:hypothetical protein